MILKSWNCSLNHNFVTVDVNQIVQNGGLCHMANANNSWADQHADLCSLGCAV